MEDIKTIKQKTFELKQYANAILADLEKNIDEERKNCGKSINEITDTKDNEIKQLNGVIFEKDREIIELRNENSQLMAAIKNVKEVMGSAIEICEGAK